MPGLPHGRDVIDVDGKLGGHQRSISRSARVALLGLAADQHRALDREEGAVDPLAEDAVDLVVAVGADLEQDPLLPLHPHGLVVDQHLGLELHQSLLNLS